MAALFIVPVPVFSFAVQGLGSHTLLFSSMEARARQFDTQFFGLDIAGEYVKKHKLPGERIMHSGHQAFGILWHADMKGTRGIPGNITHVIDAEKRLNASWLFVYQWDFSLFQDASRWDYLSQNYRPVQMAMIPGQPTPLYLLFRKGGSTNITALNEIVQGKPVLNRDYELTTGKVTVQYVNIEP
jgi:hypothetical protein